MRRFASPRIEEACERSSVLCQFEGRLVHKDVGKNCEQECEVTMDMVSGEVSAKKELTDTGRSCAALWRRKSWRSTRLTRQKEMLIKGVVSP